MQSLVEIDGSTLEGGGQILRVALTLSCLKKIPIRIFKIRAGRKNKTGLLEQHLKGVELLQQMCSAKVQGAQIGSNEVKFCPGDLRGGFFTAFVKTAGSITLLMQLAIPCAIFAKEPVTLRLFGGTNTEMAPQIDYTTEVFRPVMEKFGATFDFELIRRGYFPKGGGEVIVTIKPIQALKPVIMTELGNVTSIYGWSFVAGVLPEEPCHLMANGAASVLRKVCRNVDIVKYKEDRTIAPDTACGIILVAETDTGCILGSSALGKRGVSHEATGRMAGESLLQPIEGGACVDSFSQDQIIIFMALANGPSVVKVGSITLHTKTAIFVIEKLTNVSFTITPDSDCNIIRCTGST
ncbi:RNA 3'-terminal phosphate cyclase [Cylas formicarius]|uniref:RNA 3'-terminal phosphate cyclase n=1 Tax=Cylas formicarius TaxID=197179 RepID=UPI002958494E|nr:RNA 3'-terminal phosphate cyclase [Cylas formicarius]